MTPAIVDGRAGIQTITVDWTNVNNADRYSIEYTTDPNFNVGVRTITAETSPIRISGLNTVTIYYVRVKAMGVGYIDSDYSAPVWFETSR